MSGLRWTAEQLQDWEARRGGASVPVPRLTPVADALGPRSPAVNLHALGHLKSGEMNKTEARYAQHLEARRLAGEIVWWKFEAIRLLLAPGTTLTIDFALKTAAGELELHDVKGARAIYKDDAKVKMRWAQSMFPFTLRVVYPRRARDGGGWDIEGV